MNEPISVQEALIYVMVIVSASDNEMTDKELATIGDVVNYRLNELEYEALQLKQLIVG